MSRFRIVSSAADAAQDAAARERYPRYGHLSDYYRAISLLFPRLADDLGREEEGPQVHYPLRVFDPRSLVTPEGRSLIQRLMEVSRNVAIEDGDLGPGDLARHMSEHSLHDIRVFDLSGPLRLSLNHIFWLTRSDSDLPIRGAMIWPK